MTAALLPPLTGHAWLDTLLYGGWAWLLMMAFLFATGGDE